MLLKINDGYSHGLQFWSATMGGGGWRGRGLGRYFAQIKGTGGRPGTALGPKPIELTPRRRMGLRGQSLL